MNNFEASHPVKSYEDLIQERMRLEQLIQNQKNIIRHDLDELKNQFRQEVKPALDATVALKKFFRPERRNALLLKLAATLLLDIAFKKTLRNSNVITQIVIPRVLKTVTTGFIDRVTTQKINTR